MREYNVKTGKSQKTKAKSAHERKNNCHSTVTNLKDSHISERVIILAKCMQEACIESQDKILVRLSNRRRHVTRWGEWGEYRISPDPRSHQGTDQLKLEKDRTEFLIEFEQTTTQQQEELHMSGNQPIRVDAIKDNKLSDSSDTDTTESTMKVLEINWSRYAGAKTKGWIKMEYPLIVLATPNLEVADTVREEEENSVRIRNYAGRKQQDQLSSQNIRARKQTDLLSKISELHRIQATPFNQTLSDCFFIGYLCHVA